MKKEEIENLIRKIVKKLYRHCMMWHLGISDEK